MLKRIKIQGYKSLVDVEVHLQPLTVLFGPNASGKSNFLDALQLLSKLATSEKIKDAFNPPYRGTPLESFTFGSGGIQSLIAQDRVSFSIEGHIELSQTTIDYVNAIFQTNATNTQDHTQVNVTDEKKDVKVMTDISNIHEKQLRYRLVVEMLPKSGILRIASESLTVLNTNGQEIQGMVSENPSDASFLSIPAFRYHSMLPYLTALREELSNWFFFYLEPRERMRMPTAIKEVRHIGLMGDELAAFLNTLRALDAPQFRAVEKALHTVVPAFTSIDIGVNSFGEVELRLMQEQTPVPARVLSEGTLRILGLLALGGAKEPPSLLGFEEPENGVHPDRLDLIALLLENLANNGTQVIVTTHSPTLLDLVPIESLYLFRQINSVTSIDPLSSWRDKGKEGTTRPVSERILRGDFNA
jgi:predicted ATPase